MELRTRAAHPDRESCSKSLRQLLDAEVGMDDAETIKLIKSAEGLQKLLESLPVPR